MALSPHISLVPQGIFYTIFICWLKLKIFFAGGKLRVPAPLGYNIAGILSHSSFQLNPTSQHHQVSIVTASINVNFPISLPGQGTLSWSSLLTIKESAAGMKHQCLKTMRVAIIWRMDWKGWVWWPENQLEDYYSLRNEANRRHKM